MSTSHACGLEEGGMPKERYQRYHEEKAKGGIRLTMFGGSSNVAPDSPSVFQQLYVGDDEVIPNLQQFSEPVRKARRGYHVSDHPSRTMRGTLFRSLVAYDRALAHMCNASLELPEGNGRRRYRSRRGSL